VAKGEKASESAPALARLRGRKHISLETFRQDGSGVATPVWFVIDDGRLFCRSSPETHKVRRMRRNPAVTIAPCTFRGRVKGDRIAARVEMIPESEWPRLNGLYERRYRLAHTLDRLSVRLGRESHIGPQLFYEIVPEQR